MDAGPDGEQTWEHSAEVRNEHLNGGLEQPAMKYNIYVDHPTDIYLAYRAANQWLGDKDKYPDTKIIGYTYNEAGITRTVSLKQNKSSVSIWVYKE